MHVYENFKRQKKKSKENCRVLDKKLNEAKEEVLAAC